MEQSTAGAAEAGSATGRAWRWAVLVVGLALGALHAYVRSRGPAYAGPLLVASHLFTLLLTTAVLGLCAAAGGSALRRAGIRFDSSLETLPFATATGVALVGTALLLAGALGLLRPWAVLAIFTGLLVWTRAGTGALATELGRLPDDVRRAIPSQPLRVLAITATVAAAVLLLLPSLAPPSDWDSLNYHLDVPADYLVTGWVGLPEDNLHATLIGPVQLLYLPLLALGATSGPAVLNALLALALALSLLACASRLLSPEAAAFTTVALWGNTILLYVASTPRVDATLCLYTFLGHYALLLAWPPEGGRRMYWLSAALLGAAVGVKLQALPYILALLPLVLWLAWRTPWAGAGSPARDAADPQGSPEDVPAPPARLLAALRCVVPYAALGVLAASPWLIRNQVLVGAPFYPLFSDPVLPPWLAEIAGSRSVPPGIDPYVSTWLSEVREPFNLRDAFFDPASLSVDTDRGAFFFTPLLLLLPLALLSIRNRNVFWLTWGGLGYLVALLVRDPRTNLRYLIPGAVPLTTVAVFGLLLALRPFSERVRMRVALVAVLASLFYTATAVTESLVPASVLEYAAGTRSEVEYQLEPNKPGHLRGILEAFVPPEGRVLFLFEARGFGVDRQVLQDPHATNWPYLVALGAPERCLEGTGITHILVDRVAVGYWSGRGMDLERLDEPAFRAFEARCLRLTARTGRYFLYEVVST